MKKMRSRLLSILLSVSLLVCFIPFGSTVALSSSDVSVVVNGNMVSIGNEFLVRNFSIVDGTLKTESIVNFRPRERIGSDIVFVPGEGSEDFIINTALAAQIAEPDGEILRPSQPLDRTGWTATGFCPGNGVSKNANALLDGNESTIAEFGYPEAITIPAWIEFDLQEVKSFQSFSYLKRPGATSSTSGVNGTIVDYVLYISSDKETWEKVVSGTFPNKMTRVGNLYNVGETQYVNLGRECTARYVRLEAVSVLTSFASVSGAEFNLYEDPYKTPLTPTLVPTAPLSKTGWVGTAYCPETGWTKSLSNLLDGDANTIVEFGYPAPEEITLPSYFEFDLGAARSFKSFSYLKRPGNASSSSGVNGTIVNYNFYVSNDKETWEKVVSGTFPNKMRKVGTLYNVGETQYVNLGQEYTARYVRLEAVSLLTSFASVSGAEFNLYADSLRTSLDRTGWSGSAADSGDRPEADLSVMLDGNKDTYVDYAPAEMPVAATFELGGAKTFDEFLYLKRPGGADAQDGIDGTVQDYEFYVYDDAGETWIKAAEGTFPNVLKTEGGLYNVGEVQRVKLDKVYTSSKVRLAAKSAMGTPSFSGAEFYLYSDVPKPERDDNNDSMMIKSSAMKLAAVDPVKTVDIDGGKQLIFTFAPYVKNDATWNITYNLVMYDGDNYMRSFLELSVPDDETEKAKIDYIDVDAFKLDPAIPDERLFCRPEKVIRRYMNDYLTGLGQPIYVNGLFFGIEFTNTDNRILPFPKAANADKIKAIQMRYYSGKTFDKLKKTADGKFVTWPEVLGAARTNDYEVVQDDFYEYIEKIACEAPFRSQFNTWYSDVMNVTPASVTKSFMEIEQGITQAGHPPMDGYVCDDGYNDYSGDFWGWKNAFENDALLDISKMLTAVGGNLGLWIGPRGGYGSPGNFARIMEMAGTAYLSSDGSICVGAPKYQERIKNLMINYQQQYNIDFWKIDGLTSNACTNPAHGHLIGGVQAPGLTATESGVYFFTELFENWLNIFDELHANGPNGEEVFLNVTSNAMPSPWILQHVNTVYLQTSYDSGTMGYGDYASRMMSFRDSKYWEFYINNKYQVPANHIWNHDPDYSPVVSGFTVLSDQQLRGLLYNNAMRGTVLYELYFSPSVLTEGQWMATAEAMMFAKEKSYVLKNSRMIAPTGLPGTIAGGNTANEGVPAEHHQPYIYSAWVEDEGYLMLRNPQSASSNAETRTLTITLDRLAGVKEGMKDLTMTYVFPSIVSDRKTYSYGDTISMTLAPNEMVVLRFAKPDTQAPSVVRTEVMDEKTLRVFFNEAINMTDPMKAGAAVAGHTVAGASLTADYRATEIKIADTFADNEAISAALTVKDLSENQTTAAASARYAAGRVISAFESASDLTAGASVSTDPLLEADVVSLNGNTVSFANGASADETTKLTVSALVRTTDTDAGIISQAGAYDVSIDAEGNPVFTVGALTVTGDKAVNDGDWHLVTCVKEPNEMLKIYLDGKINASIYIDGTPNILKASAVTIGSSAFTGDLANLFVANKSYGWKEIEELNRQPLGHYAINNTNAFTITGMEPSLPKTVQARYDTSDYFRNYNAVWNTVDGSALAAPGKATLTGSIPGFKNEISGRLSVIDAYPEGDPLTSLNRDKWTILNENASRRTFSSSGVTITAAPSRMDRGNAYGGYENENFFLTDPGMDDYCVTIAVDGIPTVLNQQAGLIFYQDDENYMRLTRRISGNASNGATNAFELHFSDDGKEFALLFPQNIGNPTRAYLALDKKGEYYTGYFSANGTDWKKVGTLKATLTEPKVGFYAALGVFPVNGITNNYSPTFSNFKILQHSVGLSIDTLSSSLRVKSGAAAPKYAWADAVFSDGSEEALLVQLPAIDPALLEDRGTFTVKGTVAGEAVQVDVSVAVGDPFESIGVTLGVSKLVEVCAANIPVSVDPKYDGAAVFMEGADGTAVIKNGKAVLHIDKAPDPGVYKIHVLQKDIAMGYAEITVASGVGLWTPVLRHTQSGLEITFASEISGAITTDKGPAVIGENNRTLTVDFENPEAGTIIVKKVKYPDLFPSYSFTFTLAYGKVPDRYPATGEGDWTTPILLAPAVSAENKTVLEFDLIPAHDTTHGVIGLAPSGGLPTAWSQCPIVIRMYTNGYFEPYNGTAYRTSSLRYAKDVNFHFKIVVDLANRRYDIFVTTPDNQTTQIASNYAFRTSAPSPTDDISKIFAISGGAPTTEAGCFFVENPVVYYG